MLFIIVVFLILWLMVLGIRFYAKHEDQELIQQVTQITRGESSERKVVLELLKQGINPRAIFHDVYIKKPNGEYTQVDLVVATKAGIIVFEVKDYSGWIFGNEHQRYWTQILSYGKEKHRFYNPIMQNQGHIQAIRKCLPQNPGIPIFSVIVFFGSCQLKDVTYSKNSTYIIYPSHLRNVVSEILSHPDANFGNKYEIMHLFTEAVHRGNDSMIVSSQINSVAHYSRYKPQSKYKRSSPSLFRFKMFPRRRRFW